MDAIKKLASGLRILIVPMMHVRSVAIGVFVGAGTITEGDNEKGLSHFIEHMLFKGTESRTAFQLAEEAESQGIQLNAYTTKRMTVYYAAGISEHIGKCADMLSDMLFCSTFSSECIEREQGVVCEEIAMYEDDPDDVAHEQVTKAHFKGTLLEHSILGTVDSVKSFDKKAILAYMDRVYTPDNIVVCIAGNISDKDGEALINDYFESHLTPKQNTLQELPEYQPGCLYNTEFKDIAQVNVAFSFRSFPYGVEKEAIGCMSDTLCGGMSGRLFQRVREELGLVYSIYAENSSWENNGMYHIHFATTPKSLKAAVLATREVILDFLKEGVKEKELSKYIEQCKSELVLGLESSSGVMRVFGRAAMLDHEKFDVDKKLAKISALTTEQVNVAARKILDFDSMSAAYVGRKSKVNIYRLMKEGC